MVCVSIGRGDNSLCFDSPGIIYYLIVDTPFSITEGFDYPLEFAKIWKGTIHVGIGLG